MTPIMRMLFVFNMNGSAERDNLCNKCREKTSLLDSLYCIFTLSKHIYDLSPFFHVVIIKTNLNIFVVFKDKKKYLNVRST